MLRIDKVITFIAIFVAAGWGNTAYDGLTRINPNTGAREYAMYGTWNDARMAEKYGFNSGDKVYFSDRMLTPWEGDSIGALIGQDRKWRFGASCFSRAEAEQNMDALAWRSRPYWSDMVLTTWLDTINFVFDVLANMDISDSISNRITSAVALFGRDRARMPRHFFMDSTEFAVPYVKPLSPCMTGGVGAMANYPDMFWYYDFVRRGLIEAFTDEVVAPRLRIFELRKLYEKRGNWLIF